MKPNKIFTSGSRVIVKTIDGCYEGLVAYYKRDPIQITLIDVKSRDARNQINSSSLINFFENEIIDITDVNDNSCLSVEPLSNDINRSTDVEYSTSSENISDVSQSYHDKQNPNSMSIDISKYLHIMINDLGSALSVLESSYEDCDKIGVRIYSTHSTGLFLSDCEIAFISIKIGKFIYCFDFQAIKRNINKNEESLMDWVGKYLKSDKILKIVHFCPYVSRFLYKKYKISFQNTIDLDACFQILYRDIHKNYPRKHTRLSELIRDNIDSSLYDVLASSEENINFTKPICNETLAIVLIESYYLIDLYIQFEIKQKQRLASDTQLLMTVVRDCDENELPYLFKNHTKSFLYEHSNEIWSENSDGINAVSLRVPQNPPPAQKHRTNSQMIQQAVTINRESSPKMVRSSTILSDLTQSTNSKLDAFFARQANNNYLDNSFGAALERENRSKKKSSSLAHFNFRPAGFCRISPQSRFSK